eukprot:tig00000197_g15695.t1
MPPKADKKAKAEAVEVPVELPPIWDDPHFQVPWHAYTCVVEADDGFDKSVLSAFTHMPEESVYVFSLMALHQEVAASTETDPVTVAIKQQINSGQEVSYENVLRWLRSKITAIKAVKKAKLDEEAAVKAQKEAEAAAAAEAEAQKKAAEAAAAAAAGIPDGAANPDGMDLAGEEAGMPQEGFDAAGGAGLGGDGEDGEEGRPPAKKELPLEGEPVDAFVFLVGFPRDAVQLQAMAFNNLLVDAILHVRGKFVDPLEAELLASQEGANEDEGGEGEGGEARLKKKAAAEPPLPAFLRGVQEAMAGSERSFMHDIQWLSVEAAKHADVAELIPSLLREARVGAHLRRLYGGWLAATTPLVVPSYSGPEAADQREYGRVLDALPAAAVDVQAVVHALVAQVARSAAGAALPPRQLGPEEEAAAAAREVAAAFDAAFSRLALAPAGSASPPPAPGAPAPAQPPAQASPRAAEPPEPAVVRHGDRIGERLWHAALGHRAAGQELAAEAARLRDLLPFPGVGGRFEPGEPPRSLQARGAHLAALKHALEAAGGPGAARRAPLLLLEELVRGADPGYRHGFADRALVEALSPEVLPQALTEAARAAGECGQLLARYDDVEDALLLALHTPVPPERVAVAARAITIPRRLSCGEWHAVVGAQLKAASTGEEGDEAGGAGAGAGAEDEGDGDGEASSAVPGLEPPVFVRASMLPRAGTVFGISRREGRLEPKTTALYPADAGRILLSTLSDARGALVSSSAAVQRDGHTISVHVDPDAVPPPPPFDAIVLSGPSGAGKSTLIRRLVSDFPDTFAFAVSHTTRPPRHDEKVGVHYNFCSRQFFEQGIASGLFFEHSEVHGHLYGTSVVTLDRILHDRKVPVLDINLHGVKSLHRTELRPFCVFVQPPSLQALEERMKAAGVDAEQVARRLAEAEAEMKWIEEPGLFQSSVVNDSLDVAYEHLKEAAFEHTLAARRPLVVSGPSGAGKSALIERLMAAMPGRFGFCVSHTTREPRQDEKDGVHYHFRSRAQFEKDAAEGKFVETSEAHGELYGTSLAAIRAVLGGGRTCILDLDSHGVKSLKARTELRPFCVFVQPPSLEVLEQRLRARGTDSEEVVARRLAAAPAELEAAEEPGLFDRVIVNDDLERASAEFAEAAKAVDAPARLAWASFADDSTLAVTDRGGETTATLTLPSGLVLRAHSNGALDQHYPAGHPLAPRPPAAQGQLPAAPAAPLTTRPGSRMPGSSSRPPGRPRRLGAPAGTWTVTNSAGRRSARPPGAEAGSGWRFEADLGVAAVTDAETGVTLTTREDLVLTVTGATEDGGAVVEFADGTRLTRSGDGATTTIEAARYARVRVENGGGRRVAELPDGTRIGVVSASGEVFVQKPDGSLLRAVRDRGRAPAPESPRPSTAGEAEAAAAAPAPAHAAAAARARTTTGGWEASGQPAEGSDPPAAPASPPPPPRPPSPPPLATGRTVYTIDYGEGSVSCVDAAGSRFAARLDGTHSVKLGPHGQPGGALAAPDFHGPRLFAVRRDGSALEFLRAADVAAFAAAAAAQGALTSVLEEDVPGEKGARSTVTLTRVRPFFAPPPPLPSMRIPGLAAEQPPEFTRYRSLTQLAPLPGGDAEAGWAALAEALAKFRAWQKAQDAGEGGEAAAAEAEADGRSEAEVAEARAVQERLLASGAAAGRGPRPSSARAAVERFEAALRARAEEERAAREKTVAQREMIRGQIAREKEAVRNEKAVERAYTNFNLAKGILEPEYLPKRAAPAPVPPTYFHAPDGRGFLKTNPELDVGMIKAAGSTRTRLGPSGTDLPAVKFPPPVSEEKAASRRISRATPEGQGQVSGYAGGGRSGSAPSSPPRDSAPAGTLGAGGTGTWGASSKGGSARPSPPPPRTVYGTERRAPLRVPNVYRSEAVPEPNERYSTVEAPVRRQLRTASTLGSHAPPVETMRVRPQQFRLHPAALRFGVVRAGEPRRRPLSLANTSLDTGHFRAAITGGVNGPFRVLFKPGPVSAGMRVKLEVEVTPPAPGELSATLTVTTEFEIFKVEVTATALSDEEYDAYMAARRASKTTITQHIESGARAPEVDGASSGDDFVLPPVPGALPAPGATAMPAPLA